MATVLMQYLRSNPNRNVRSDKICALKPWRYPCSCLPSILENDSWAFGRILESVGRSIIFDFHAEHLLGPSV